MFARNLVVFGSALLLQGCQSWEGLYAPSCIAYAGSEIRLGGGRYVWTKFTDQVAVDASGNKVDPFPGFPREGAYSKQGNRIILATGDGEPDVTMQVVVADGQHYLYTADEAAAFEATGKRPACPLRLQDPD